jgi:DNA-directed RNA polymerase subunit M/transcription elongation factor TFIIS
MEQQQKRTCPECKSRDYRFRGRKKIAEDGKPEEFETKYKCKACGFVWSERTPTAGLRGTW